MFTHYTTFNEALKSNQEKQKNIFLFNSPEWQKGCDSIPLYLPTPFFRTSIFRTLSTPARILLYPYSPNFLEKNKIEMFFVSFFYCLLMVFNLGEDVLELMKNKRGYFFTGCLRDIFRQFQIDYYSYLILIIKLSKKAAKLYDSAITQNFFN